MDCFQAVAPSFHFVLTPLRCNSSNLHVWARVGRVVVYFIASKAFSVTGLCTANASYCASGFPTFYSDRMNRMPSAGILGSMSLTSWVLVLVTAIVLDSLVLYLGRVARSLNCSTITMPRKQKVFYWPSWLSGS